MKLYADAAKSLDLNTRESWYVGDRIRDVAPGDHFGGRSVMLIVDSTPDFDRAAAVASNRRTAPSLAAAVDIILGASK